MDVDPPLSIQEEGTFIDRKKLVAYKPEPEQADTDTQSSPDEVQKVPEDSQVGLEEKKRRKRKKRRRRKLKKCVITSSTFTKTDWKDHFWILTCLSFLLIAGTTAFSVQKLTMEEVPENQHDRSEEPVYKSFSEDVCTAEMKVTDPPIIMNLNSEIQTLNPSVQCPDKAKHFGIESCFKGKFFLKVSFKKGRNEFLFIEHGKERSPPTIVYMNSEACYLSVEDQTTTKPKRSDDGEANKDTKAINNSGGVWALCLILLLLGALLFVAKYKREQEQQFSRLLEQEEVNVENGAQNGRT
ncbi:uncharacterized protein [Pyxicephalus adspersus]|uniref:Uncharacterized protein n=1 Tax=Pyxicephalus adspersus TaxID=30357 RepID=A0AAV2ZUT2_PYXAD|nr:TPA: hypothetical protein GDO54_003233 [Pyxicephalus adspersus]